MLTAGSRALRVLGRLVEEAGELTHGMLGVVLMLLMLAAWVTDSLGIHAVFGGFILGVAMPRGLLAAELERKLEPIAVVFFLPMFFTFSGLNTRLGVLASPGLVLVALAVLAVACLGKGVACWAAARFCGEDNRTALAVGALMNARGLVGLILLNIGLQKGVLQPPLFSIMTVMALATTLAASPLYHWVHGRHRADRLEAA